MKQPSLVIRRKGRPSNTKNAEEERRAKHFMEDLKDQAASQLCLLEAAHGSAANKNPGGKGVPKTAPTCSVCQQVGHRSNRCPSRGADGRILARSAVIASTVVAALAAVKASLSGVAAGSSTKKAKAPPAGSASGPGTKKAKTTVLPRGTAKPTVRPARKSPAKATASPNNTSSGPKGRPTRKSPTEPTTSPNNPSSSSTGGTQPVQTAASLRAVAVAKSKAEAAQAQAAAAVEASQRAVDEAEAAREALRAMEEAEEEIATVQFVGEEAVAAAGEAEGEELGAATGEAATGAAEGEEAGVEAEAEVEEEAEAEAEVEVEVEEGSEEETEADEGAEQGARARAAARDAATAAHDEPPAVVLEGAEVRSPLTRSVTGPLRANEGLKPHEYSHSDFLLVNQGIFRDELTAGGPCVKKFGEMGTAMRDAAAVLSQHCVEHWSVGKLRMRNVTTVGGFKNFHYVQGEHDPEMQAKDTAILRMAGLGAARRHLPALKTMEKLIHAWAEALPIASGRKAMTAGIDFLRQRGLLSTGVMRG